MTQKLNIITQAELEHLQAIEAEYWTLRNNINERVLAGAVVEPGSQSIAIETRHERRITQETLRMTLGYSLAEPIIHAVPRTTKHYMVVTRGTEADAHGHLGPVFDPYLNKEDGEVEENPRMSLPRLLEVLTEEVGSKLADRLASQVLSRLDLEDDPDAGCA